MRFFSTLTGLSFCIIPRDQNQPFYPKKTQTAKPSSRFSDFSSLRNPVHPFGTNYLAFAKPQRPRDISKIQSDLNQKGFYVLNSQAHRPSIKLLKNWVQTVKGLYPKGHNGNIKLRWQRFSGSPNHPNQHPWQLKGSPPPSQALLELPNTHELFTPIEHYFDSITNTLSQHFPSHLNIIQEIRYLDLEEQEDYENTLWHLDGIPIFLTASCTWLGPSTLFEIDNNNKLGNKNGNQTSTGNNDVEDSHQGTTRTGDTLIFYGKSGDHPVRHKSPKINSPRLLLLVRMLDKPK